MRTEITSDRSFIRAVAGASRKPDENLSLSPLQAIDKLQKLSEKFREQWVFPSPWLVLEDCWTLPASMPVPKMLEDIAKHGQPIGIVGIAWLKSVEQDALLRMRFRGDKDKKSEKMIEVSAQAAKEDFNARRQAVFSAQVFLDASGEHISLHYSFHPAQTPEPGSTKVGSIVYSADGRVRCHFQRKEFADVMEESKARFNKVVKKLQEIQSAEVQ